MDQHDFDALCNEVLTLIEFEEARLINWGFIDAPADLDFHLADWLDRLRQPWRALWEQAVEDGYAPRHIIDNLLERRLIQRNERGLYRTRFAETLRLLSLLRQRFSYDDWSSASRLVSDLRTVLRRRAYPRREGSVGTLLESMPYASTEFSTAVQLLLQGPYGQPISIAEFQQRAMIASADALRNRSGRHAIVVGAGTGAGKTKAFYVPAMAHIVDDMLNTDTSPRVRVIAIYPRTELLKDQLAEAYSEARKLDELLQSHSVRKITVGAYYGDTVLNAQDSNRFGEGKNWPPDKTEDGRKGYVSPYMRCPRDGGRLLWLEQEKEANQYHLVCEHTNCGTVVSGKDLLLTREQMKEHPPDILFTTTEMLNRCMSSIQDWKLFGIEESKPPRLLLLDEIHTYEGTNGAQIAYLLRRWQYACRHGERGRPLLAVGLSATLTDGPTFFGKLVNLPENRVTYVAPEPDEMIEEGAEYNVVLKGDPVSMTALLSTSVQTVMLLGRMLDPLPDPNREPVSRWAYGQRIFAFSDKLDVVNRWRRIQHDAEQTRQLARYRLWGEDTGVSLLQRQQIAQQGQSWDFAWRIQTDDGDEPSVEPLHVTRTSSRDRGVDERAKVVVATSSLEVGFNDHSVGAVIQHKAPRSMASFLQRKGRAGRDRMTRPWMVVVTSAYGRDRWAFQHAESLFDPLLPPINLPVNNDYVLKIQSTFALMDWIAHRLGGQFPWLVVYRQLSTNKPRNFQNERQAVADLLQRVISDKATRVDLRRYLRKALAVDDAIVDQVLWGEPRSLLLEVIPTILRELHTQWGSTIYDPQSDKVIAVEMDDRDTSYNPLPQFVPSALFNDLNLPEVLIRIETRHGTRDREGRTWVESEKLLTALSEFTPGKPNERYSPSWARRTDRHQGMWVPITPDENNRLSLEQITYYGDGREHDGYFTFDRPPIIVELNSESISVYRPRSIRLVDTPQEIAASSNAFFRWRTHITPVTSAGNLDLSRSHWTERVIESCEAFLQANGAAAHVTRMAIGVDGAQRSAVRRGEEHRFSVTFNDFGTSEEPAAIGFQIRVDALKFRIRPLDVADLIDSGDFERLYRTLGPNYMRHRLQTDDRLTGGTYQLTQFEIDWLFQIEYTMLVEEAIASNITLSEAAQNVARNRSVRARDVLQRIFQAEQYGEGEYADDARSLDSRLVQWLQRAEVNDALNEASAALWEHNGDAFYDWLSDVYRASVASALYHAATQIVDDIDADSVAMDIVGDDVWLTETTPGGIGLIQSITIAIAERPRAFTSKLDDLVYHCDREYLAMQLDRLTDLIASDTEDITDAFAAIRSQEDLVGLDTARRQLQSSFKQHGLPVTRQLMVAVNAKYLRPNSSPRSDTLITHLVETWRTASERLGVTIDLRAIAASALRITSVDLQLDLVLDEVNASGTLSPDKRYNLLQSLLWLTCHDSCQDCLGYWSPYGDIAHPSRHLLQAVLQPVTHYVNYDADDWREQLIDRLVQDHQANLICEQDDLKQFKGDVAVFITQAVDAELQLFYPIIERIEQQTHVNGISRTVWVVQFVLRELAGY